MSSTYWRMATMTVLVVVAGCGPPSADASWFQTAGKDICRQAMDRLDPLAELLFDGDQPTDLELQDFHTILVTDLQRQIAEFEAIQVEPGLVQEVERYLDAAKAATERVEELGPEGLLGDDDPFADADEIALDLGLDVCTS